jgi:hypothetical protein
MVMFNGIHYPGMDNIKSSPAPNRPSGYESVGQPNLASTSWSGKNTCCVVSLLQHNAIRNSFQRILSKGLDSDTYCK